jgi:chromosome segregation ATPase
VSSEVDQLKSDLKDSQATTGRHQDHIKVLEKRHSEMEAIISALEKDVARLEAEGLKPLVERLRVQIGAMRKLLVAMAQAIDELTNGGDQSEEVAEAVEEAVEETKE